MHYDVAELRDAKVNNEAIFFGASLEKLRNNIGKEDSLIIKKSDFGDICYYYKKGMIFRRMFDYSSGYSIEEIDFTQGSYSVSFDGVIISGNTQIDDFKEKYPLAYLNMSSWHKEGFDYKEIHLGGMSGGNIFDYFRIEFIFEGEKLVKLQIVST